jgi:dextranase
LVYMDPRPDSPWVNHLLAQFDQVLEQTAFDGIHLDQYGDPKEGYDSQGQRFDLAGPLAATINATKELVRSRRAQGAVVFNAVTNWPIEDVAPADQDFVYIEVWPPYTWFDDLHGLITKAQDLGGGKPVVLAAYIDPSLEHNVRLVDAVIFASGGGHIELGERGGMLADAYFPRYKTMSPEMAETIRRYYDFAVRYEDVIGPATQDATQHYLSRIAIDGVSTSPSQRSNKVLPIARHADGSTAISLINLVGIKSPEWARPLEEPPQALGALNVRINVEQTPARAWMATPDGADPAAHPLAFRTGTDESGDYVLLEVPSLKYWSMIVFEWRGQGE